MSRILIHWAVTVVAVFVAAKLVPGIHYDNWVGLALLRWARRLGWWAGGGWSFRVGSASLVMVRGSSLMVCFPLAPGLGLDGVMMVRCVQGCGGAA